MSGRESRDESFAAGLAGFAALTGSGKNLSEGRPGPRSTAESRPWVAAARLLAGSTDTLGRCSASWD